MDVTTQQDISEVLDSLDSIERSSFPKVRQGLRFSLVKKMRESQTVADKVAEIVLRKMRYCQVSEKYLTDLLAILCGNHGVEFSSRIRGEIQKMRRWRRWSELPEESPAHIFLRKC